ncbi:hypothetical protein RSAG8_11920, partial [Rhizoctonia solani AG-8 WAC10335]
MDNQTPLPSHRPPLINGRRSRSRTVPLDMPGQFPQYVRTSQRYAPVQTNIQGSGEKIISLATSPTLMSDGLPSTELDRMTMILSERLREVIERQDIMIEEGKTHKNYSDILARAMLTTCLMGTLLSIFTLMLKTYMRAIGRDSPGIQLMWGISLVSFVLAILLSILSPWSCRVRTRSAVQFQTNIRNGSTDLPSFSQARYWHREFRCYFIWLLRLCGYDRAWFLFIGLYLVLVFACMHSMLFEYLF